VRTPAAVSAGIRTILLTDDDGWDAEGITAAYDALSGAGYDVVLVAPRDNNSNASMYSSPGVLDAEQPDPAEPKWWVAGTPVDSVRVGLTAILEEPPDLVVSGINIGANAGYNVNYSGTVGAATTAAEYGVPGIAISADVGETAPGDFARGTNVLLDLVAALDGGSLLEMSDGAIINVNIPQPDAGAENAAPVAVARQSDEPWVDVDYVVDGAGDYSPERRPVAGDDPGTDKALLREGYTTLTVLTVARDGSEDEHPALDRVLESLAE
jgi:5'-nucleotidase